MHKWIANIQWPDCMTYVYTFKVQTDHLVANCTSKFVVSLGLLTCYIAKYG